MFYDPRNIMNPVSGVPTEDSPVLLRNLFIMARDVNYIVGQVTEAIRQQGYANAGANLKNTVMDAGKAVAHLTQAQEAVENSQRAARTDNADMLNALAQIFAQASFDMHRPGGNYEAVTPAKQELLKACDAYAELVKAEYGARVDVREAGGIPGI